jgi:integrase/recombinase XerD
MDSKTLLFSELCAAIGPQSDDVHAAIWSCLSRYEIRGTAASTSFEETVRQFLSAKQVDGLSAKTIREYRRSLAAFGAAVGNPLPAGITADDVRSYLSGLAASGLKPSSVQTYANILRSFFSWLQSEGQIDRSPMLKIRSRRLDRKHSRQPLTSRELEKVRRVCAAPRERALLEMLVSTGCRVSELRLIQLSDMDFRTRSITVTGKGSKTRLVLFSPQAELALDDYAPQSGYLFPGAAPDQPMSVRSIQKIIHALGVRAGLPSSLHPHRLRHTFATLAINRGMELPILQQLLGHESADTTEIYAKLSPGTVARAYARTVA